MFKFKKSRTSITDSKLFDEHGFFKAMSTDIRNAKTSIIIECPFITVKRSKQIALLFQKAIKKGVIIEINTRDPRHHAENLNQQSILGIEILRSAGAIVNTYIDMRHMKVAIIDSSILWEGSLNMLSHSNSREVMRRTVSDKLSKEMLQWLI